MFKIKEYSTILKGKWIKVIDVQLIEEVSWIL